MPITPDRLTRLREFGLSEYAARSYLALLDLGIADARAVSGISKVPQAKIYHVLEQLHEKGLVVILPQFPKKYAPIPFEEYLGRLFDEHSQAARSIEDQRIELAEMFRVTGDIEVGDRGFLTVLHGRKNVMAKIREIVALTEHDLVVLGTFGTVLCRDHAHDLLRSATERGVRVRLLLPVDKSTVDAVAPLTAIADVRARELAEAESGQHVGIIISDSSCVLFVHFLPDDESLHVGKDVAVFTDQEAMVAAIQAIVEPIWARALPYEARRAELAGSSAEGPPIRLAEVETARLFAHVREAIIVVDRETTIALWNPAAEQLFGLTAREAIGMPLHSIIAPEDRAAVIARLARARPVGREVAERFVVPALARGALVRMEITAIPGEGTHGAHTVLLATSLRDVPGVEEGVVERTT